jgi:hypothetical protein
MKRRTLRSARGNGNLQFVAVLLVIVGLCYAAIKMGQPYFAYRSLERTMKQWAKISLYRGGRSYSDLKEKIQYTIDRHKIPLDLEDVEIEFDPEEKRLAVYAEYHVYVTLPGYEHHYFFQPYAEAYIDED